MAFSSQNKAQPQCKNKVKKTKELRDYLRVRVSTSFNIPSEFSIRQQEFLHSNRLDFRLESCFEAILE